MSVEAPAPRERSTAPSPAVPLSQLQRALVLAIGLAGLLMAATFWLSLRSQAENQWVRHTLEIREQSKQIALLLQRLESNQRGYLLTGRESYLAAFAPARAALPGALNRMMALVDAESDERKIVDRLTELAQTKVAELQSTIDKQRAGDVEGARAIVNTDSGEQMMGDIYKQVADIVGAEDRDLASRQNSTQTLGDAVQWGAAVAFLALLAVAAIASVLARRTMRDIGASRNRLIAANNALLEQIGQRESAENQLRQSQKMEAIGQLTGGIAHDFNNMLGVITGNLELMMRRVKKGDFAIERFAESALKGAQRAATLTHRLLAFARQQPLSPESLDANRTIRQMSDLLRSTLGEHIVVESVAAGGLWPTLADPHQLENAVLNVAINARDAMPEGGKLTIETANAYLDEAYCRQNADAAPGQYVMLAVTDTGAGMSAEVVARAFDPFFTTKPTGAGTGLGLSQVYGFIKQSHGHIKIYSEIGTGTTIKIYLPRLVGEAQSSKPAPAAVIRGGDPAERVLVVEDDPSMRRMTVEAVRELGYTVFESDSAAGALDILARNPVTLLLSDVVMPEVNGKKLADEAMKRHPTLKVLFMTGYTRNAVVHGGIVDAGIQFLGKPFTIEQLAAKLRDSLDP